jgi:hypothetical protein
MQKARIGLRMQRHATVQYIWCFSGPDAISKKVPSHHPAVISKNAGVPCHHSAVISKTADVAQYNSAVISKNADVIRLHSAAVSKAADVVRCNSAVTSKTPTSLIVTRLLFIKRRRGSIVLDRYF